MTGDLNTAASEYWRAEKSEKRRIDHEALAEAKEWEGRNLKKLRRRLLPDGTLISATAERIDQLEKDLMSPMQIKKGNCGGGRKRVDVDA